MRSKSYKDDCCRTGCDFENDIEYCYGEVIPIDEIECGDDWYWIHACYGHQDILSINGEKYIPEC